MVAARIHSSPAARNVVTAKKREANVDARRKPRARTALMSWLCTEAGSARGYALDLSANGARFGGMGTRFTVGELVLCKIVVDAADPPLVLRARIVRYAPASACPELCVRFLDGDGQAVVDEQFRLARFVDSLRN